MKWTLVVGVICTTIAIGCGGQPDDSNAIVDNAGLAASMGEDESATATQTNGTGTSRRLKLKKGVKYGFYFGNNILSPLEVDNQTDDGWVTVTGHEGSSKRTFHINLANVTYIKVDPED